MDRYVQTLVATWNRRPTFAHFCYQTHHYVTPVSSKIVRGLQVDRKCCFCTCVQEAREATENLRVVDFGSQPPITTTIELNVEGQPRYWEREKAPRMRRAQHHLSGGQSPALHHEGPGSIPGESTWDLCQTVWHYDRFFSKHHYHSMNVPYSFVHRRRYITLATERIVK